MDTHSAYGWDENLARETAPESAHRAPHCNAPWLAKH